MRRSIAQYVAAPWCALAILLAACTGDGAAMEDERHVETPAPKPETPAEPDTLDTPNNPDNPDSTGNYTPKYESAKAVLKEILGDKYEDISAGMPQNITLTAQAIDAVTGISSVLESVTKASSEEHETENMTDAKTKVNTLTEKAGGSEEVLQDPSAEGLEKMLQAFNAEEAKQALQALVAQAEEMISVSKKENNELLGSFEDVNEPNKVADPKDGNNLYISASDEYKVSLSGEFDYFDNHIESLEGDIDISKLIIVSHEDRGDRVLVASSSLRKEIYEKLNLESKEGDALPTLKFGLTHDKDLGLKYFLDIYKKYNKSKKLKIDAHFISMDGRTLVEGVAEERRLMYVAITRAEKNLYLTRSKSRYLYGHRDLTRPSKFITELASELGVKTTYYPERKLEQYKSYKSSYDSDSGYESDFAPKNNITFKPAFGSVAPKKPAGTAKYSVGMRVKHAKFGVGMVVALKNGGTVINVAFDGQGIKELSASLAPLEIL